MTARKPIPLVAILSALVLSLASSGAAAEKGGKPGGGKGPPARENREGGGPAGFRFGDSDRVMAREYYRNPPRGRKCPPGLVKKVNGCLPPGQARRWIRGRPLPRHIIFYDLPRDLLYRLPPPPPRHRYVQLGSDILLVAIGTAIVVDAIENIVR